jgi:hypothetical protein
MLTIHIYRQQEVIRLLASRLIGVLLVAMVDKKSCWNFVSEHFKYYR